MKIVNVPTRELSKKTADSLNLLLGSNSNKEVLLMISGGSSLDVVQYIDPELLSEKLTISVVDERFSMDPKINNYSQLEKTSFFEKCLEKNCAIVGTKIYKGETLTRATISFEAELRKWKIANRDGIIIALLGMGKDGHTSGVLPFPDNKKIFTDLFLDPEWVAGYEAPDNIRFTTTLTFLREEVDHAVVYVQGQEKEKALKKLGSSNLEIHEFPAGIFQEMKDIRVFTDTNV